MEYVSLTTLAAQVDPVKIVPTPDQVAGWSPAQTLQWILVAVLIAVSIAAYFGMKALAKSNESVNANYDKSINFWQRWFEAQEKRYNEQDDRHATRDRETHQALQAMALSQQAMTISLQAITEKFRLMEPQK